MFPNFLSCILLVCHTVHIQDIVTTLEASGAIDGSTERCCIAIVTNERALLSGSDQPVQNLGRHRILHARRVNKRPKTATFAQRNMVHC